MKSTYVGIAALSFGWALVNVVMSSPGTALVSLIVLQIALGSLCQTYLVEDLAASSGYVFKLGFFSTLPGNLLSVMIFVFIRFPLSTNAVMFWAAVVVVACIVAGLWAVILNSLLR